MLLYNKWSMLPMHTRMKIAETFGISRSGNTHVADNRILSDGYHFGEIESHLTVKFLQDYTDSGSTDFDVLWSEMLDKLEGKTKVIEDGVTEKTVHEIPETKDVPEVKPKRKYNKKKK